jgi:hypothetical protein
MGLRRLLSHDAHGNSSIASMSNLFQISTGNESLRPLFPAVSGAKRPRSRLTSESQGS